MSVLKVIEVLASSDSGWEDAAKNAHEYQRNHRRIQTFGRRYSTQNMGNKIQKH